MPIVILLDASLSMSRPVSQDTGGRQITRASLAVAGINTLLDHLVANSRLEFVALAVFSSIFELLCSFTREYDTIRQKLRAVEDYDKTSLEDAIVGTYHLIFGEWGYQTHTHIVLVTDGCAGSAIMPSAQLPASLPCTLHILCVASPNEPSLITSTPYYRRLIERVGEVGGAPLGSLNILEQPISITSVNTMFKRFCNEQLAAWKGIIRCGALEARITLTPAPLPFNHVTDFDSVRLTMMTTLEIGGFIPMADIGSPMALSRHLILPMMPITPPPVVKTPGKSDPSEPTTPEEDSSDIGKVPNFCVLLHGALKVENLAALVQLGDDWYGFVHSWADSKKKANLMLSVLPPGDDAVPWLGPLSQLGQIDSNEQGELFPVRVSERRSYSSAGGSAGAGAAWVHPAGLQTDLHKLLRHARKLPDKMNHFYKEVNRVRRAALALGWVEALEAAACILEREAKHLPPPATIPLTLAAHNLRNTTDPKSQLPLT